MTLVRKMHDALWGSIARIVLPDPVLRLDQLDVDPAEIEREYQQLLAQRRGKKLLVAKWARADADVMGAAEHERTPSETHRGKATLEPKGSQGQ